MDGDKLEVGDWVYHYSGCDNGENIGCISEIIPPDSCSGTRYTVLWENFDNEFSLPQTQYESEIHLSSYTDFREKIKERLNV